MSAQSNRFEELKGQYGEYIARMVSKRYQEEYMKDLCERGYVSFVIAEQEKVGLPQHEIAVCEASEWQAIANQGCALELKEYFGLSIDGYHYGFEDNVDFGVFWSEPQASMDEARAFGESFLRKHNMQKAQAPA
jgi:hypothetical protein